MKKQSTKNNTVRYEKSGLRCGNVLRHRGIIRKWYRESLPRRDDDFCWAFSIVGQAIGRRFVVKKLSSGTSQLSLTSSIPIACARRLSSSVSSSLPRKIETAEEMTIIVKWILRCLIRSTDSILRTKLVPTLAHVFFQINRSVDLCRWQIIIILSTWRRRTNYYESIARIFCYTHD